MAEIIIKLSPKEIEKCTEVAKEYYHRTRAYKVDHTKYTNMSYENKVVGAKGEYAVAFVFNLKWNEMDLYSRFNGDVTGLEVKATHLATGSLIVPTDEKIENPYVLTIVDGPYVKIAGYQMPEYIKQARIEKQLTKRQSYWVNQHELLPIENLFKG